MLAVFAGYDGTFTFSTADHNRLTLDDLRMYRVKGGAWELAQ